MKIGPVVVLLALTVSACGQTIEARCAAAHQGDPSAASACAEAEVARVKARGGFGKSQRGGGG
ncbi:MAG: hypothetical protein AAF409_16615 [Pseudomonadota bacterium]